MHQDYRILGLDQIEAIEKSTLRVVVQAIQEYSWEAKQIFDKTEAASDTEVIVLAEDIVQYALEVAEFYPINKRYAGFIDYKRVRWFPAAFGVFPQALLVDAKASTENTRDTLQQSQLPMDAEFLGRDGKTVRLRAGVEPHLEIAFEDGATVAAISTSILVHFYYDNRPSSGGQQRDLRSIFVLSLPHASLKQKYNPDPQTTFFGQGKHSPARGEVPRVRVYFSRLKSACPWRLQELKYDPSGGGYTTPRWRDGDGADSESSSLFHFIPRGSR